MTAHRTKDGPPLFKHKDRTSNLGVHLVRCSLELVINKPKGILPGDIQLLAKTVHNISIDLNAKIIVSIGLGACIDIERGCSRGKQFLTLPPNSMTVPVLCEVVKLKLDDLWPKPLEQIAE